VSFGSVPINDSRTQTLELTNDGNASLDITGSSITGTDSEAFSVNGLGTPILSGKNSTTFTVKANATDVRRGSLSSKLAITTNDTTVTSTLGATATEPDIDVTGSVGTSAFGTTRLGDTSTATFEVNNTGNAELNVTDLSISGANASAFSIVEPTNTTANTTISGDGSDQVTVEFDPLAADNAVSQAQSSTQTATANLTVNSSDPDSSEQSLVVGLTGEGTTAALSVPATYQFGQTPKGQTTTAQVEIENQPKATTPLNITSVSVNGPDSSAFNVSLNGSKTTPHTLTASQTVNLNVSITPTTTGQKFATATVETNDSRQPVKKIGLSNDETTYRVDYGSVNVTYINPIRGQPAPTVNVDRGFRGRNATLRAVNANVTTTSNYALNYTYNNTAPSSLGVLNESTTGNDTAVQYLNATTDAADGNFENSTFQVEVSKATLGRQGVNKENVTIYHETNSGGYEKEDTELLFETTKGYVYEVTTDSYSVFAVGVSDPSESDGNDDDNGDDGDNSGSGGSSGGGGGGAIGGDGGGQTEQGPPSIAEIKSTLSSFVTPTTTTKSELKDAEPGSSGVTVTPVETQLVTTVSFDTEGLGGSVKITEYTDPPGLIRERISESISSTDAVDIGGEDAESSDNIDVISVANITPTTEEAEESAATVRLRVDKSKVESPKQLSVIKEFYDFEGQKTRWKRLDTTVEDTDGDTVTVSAQVEEFSLFAVTEIQEQQSTDGEVQQQNEQQRDDEDDAPPLILLAIGVLLTGILAVAGFYVRRNETVTQRKISIANIMFWRDNDSTKIAVDEFDWGPIDEESDSDSPGK
jgi:hypothetical protein